MENYFMASADGTKMYRVEYEIVDAIVTVGTVHVTGNNITLPSGLVINGIDIQIEPREMLVDTITDAVTVSDVAAYRTLAKTVAGAEIDQRW